MHGIVLFTEMDGIVVAQFVLFLGSKILLLLLVDVLFHLPYNVLGLVMILNIKIRGCLRYLIRMPAQGTEFPLLETIRVRKPPAGRTTDDKVHDNVFIDAIIIYRYRQPGIPAPEPVKVSVRNCVRHP
jgi:hypothetical protein